MKLHKLVFASCLLVCALALAEPFTFVNSSDGCSYIKVNESLGSFKISTRFKSIGSSGKVGYVIYTEDMPEDKRRAYLAENATHATISKHSNIADIGSLRAGEKVGFYLQRSNGDVVLETRFVSYKGHTWLEFDKKNHGSGKDEWMMVSNISADVITSGAPLPGALPVAMIGLGVLLMRRRRRGGAS